MGSDKQIQKAGDGAQQFQAQSIYISNGITEERARAICLEMAKSTLAECTEEATKTATDRIEQFAKVLVPRIHQVEEDFRSFAEPSFQVLLRKAQLTSACTGREEDYKILSELLVHRVKNKENIKKKASITKAVEILDQIDEDSLLGLTVFQAIDDYGPSSGIIREGLSSLDMLYSTYDLDSLPNNSLWIDNLVILGAATMNTIGTLYKFTKRLTDGLTGYVCTGIKGNSAEHEEACRLLLECDLPKEILIKNELLDGYMRLTLPYLDRFEFGIPFNQEPDSDSPPKTTNTIDLNAEQIAALKAVIALYDQNKTLINSVKEHFTSLLSNYPSICKARDWWDSISPMLSLTSVGRVIAHTNSKSINQMLPDLD